MHLLSVITIVVAIAQLSSAESCSAAILAEQMNEYCRSLPNIALPNTTVAQIAPLLERVEAAEQFLKEVSQSTSELINEMKAIAQRFNMTCKLRLKGGLSPREGRVEVFQNGVWGTVCDDLWDISDANVTCRMLGYERASSAPGGARYGEGSGTIWLDDVNCNGTESTLWDCDTNPWGNTDCSHSEDASVVCV